MRYLFLILLTGQLLRVGAQARWTLTKCVEYTLENHPSVSVYANNRAVAREQSWQQVAAYLPEVNGAATFTDNIQLQTTILPAGILGNEPSRVQFGTQYSTIVGLDFSQTIYDQSKIVGIKAGEPYKRMASLQEIQNQELLVYNTSKAYFQVLIYREQLSVLRTNQSKYREMLKTLQVQLSKGVVLEQDVDRVRVNLYSTEYQIQDALTKEQLAVNTLKYVMGMELDQTLDLEDHLDYALIADAKLSDDLEVELLTSFQINQQQVALQEINVRMQKAKYSPTISFVGKYATQAMNNDLDNAFSSWNPFSYVGLSLKLPVFTGFGRNSRLREEQLNLDNEKINLKLYQQNLRLSFENAQTSVGTAYSTFLSNRDNLALSRKLLEVTEYQYEQGTTHLIDYLNDDAAYRNAQSNYINSLYNLLISQLDYQKAQGTLLDFISTLK